MPWVELEQMNLMNFTEMKSSNLIAQETRSQAANGNKLGICNLQERATCLLHYQNLMMSVEYSATRTTTNSPKTNGTTKIYCDLLFFFDQSLYICQTKKLT